MKYHHTFIRCVAGERISVCSWGQLDEQGRLVYESPEDGTVHVEIFTPDRDDPTSAEDDGDIELFLTPRNALMLGIAVQEAICDLHRTNGWPHRESAALRLVSPTNRNNGQESHNTTAHNPTDEE